jgi:hypothetical protein
VGPVAVFFQKTTKNDKKVRKTGGGPPWDPKFSGKGRIPRTKYHVFGFWRKKKPSETTFRGRVFGKSPFSGPLGYAPKGWFKLGPILKTADFWLGYGDEFQSPFSGNLKTSGISEKNVRLWGEKLGKNQNFTDFRKPGIRGLEKSRFFENFTD